MPVPGSIAMTRDRVLNERVSIRRFGARAGLADNTAAIQAAIDAYQGTPNRVELHFPAANGPYVFDGSLVIKAGGVFLKGDGRLATRLHLNSATAEAIICDGGLLDPKVFTASAGTDKLTVPANPFVNGQRIRVMNSGGALPAPLAQQVYYFVRDVVGDDFKLAATETGAAIDLTTDGTGTNSILWNAGSGVGFEDMTIDSFDLGTLSRTAGSSIRIQNFGDYRCKGLYLRHGYDCLQLRSAHTGVIEDLTIDNYAPGGVPLVSGQTVHIGVLVTDNCIATDFRTVRINQGGGVISAAGIQIDKGIDTLTIDALICEHSLACVNIVNDGDPVNSPNYDHPPRWVKIHKSFVEGDDTNGAGFNMSSGHGIDLTDNYCKGGKYGMHFSGDVDSVKVSGGEVILAQQYGILADNGTLIDLSTIRVSKNGQSALNTYSGIAIGAGVTKVRVQNLRSSNWLFEAFPNSQKYGLFIGAGADYITVCDCDFRDNTTGPYDNQSAGLNIHIDEVDSGYWVNKNGRGLAVRDTAGKIIPVMEILSDNVLYLGTLDTPASNGDIIVQVKGSEAYRVNASDKSIEIVGALKALQTGAIEVETGSLPLLGGAQTTIVIVGSTGAFQAGLAFRNDTTDKWLLAKLADDSLAMYDATTTKNFLTVITGNTAIGENGNTLTLVGAAIVSNGPLNISSGGFSVAGTEIVTSGLVLQSVTANASIITTGQLALARGGTAVDNTNITANLVFAGPSSGGAGNATFRSLVADDIPNISGAKITSGTVDAARLGASPTAAKFLKGDNSWATISAGDVPALSYVSTGGGFGGGGSATLAKLTPGGNPGSITWNADGIITGYTAPT